MKTKNTAYPKLFIGIDIHKRSWKIHTSTDLFDGRSISMPPDPLALKQYVERNFPGHQVHTAYEAGCCGYSAHRAFCNFGWRSLVVNPADISRTGQTQHQKTDTIDARLICRELKDERLKSIAIPEVEREHLRCLFRRRNDLVKEFRKIKTKIKSQLLYLGIEVPDEFDNANWSKAFRNWIRSQVFEYETVKFSLESRLLQYDFIDKNVREVSNELRKYCRKHFKTDYYLLRSVPGIGGIVACGILSELGDLRRFSNFNQLAAYVGLIPSIKSTGEKQTIRGINPRGNRIMRSYFVEAAWQALRFDPVMQQYYRSHHGKDSKAILVKVARKLLSRTHAVIKSGIPYEAGIVV